MFLAVSLLVSAAIVCLVTCQDECGPPPEIERAKISDPSDSPYALGSSVTYKCDYGFITGSAGKISRCSRDPVTRKPVWTRPDIICNPRSCGDPGFVANARRSGSRFTFPNNVEYICNEGYKLSGPSRRYCEASGSWSGRLPTCSVISCRRPSDPENGRALYSSLEYDSELTYECSKGLQLSFNQPRACGSNGEWTGTEPICRETECELPKKPDFGTMELVGNKARVGSIIIYKCDPGRKLVGSSSAKCIKTGEWTFPTPLCVEPCEVPSVDNGDIGRYVEEYSRFRWRNVFKKVPIGTTLDEGEEVILKCEEDYVSRGGSSGEIKVTCQNGQLSPQPECITTSCSDDPPHAENAKPVIRSRKHGYTIWYQCNYGFENAQRGEVTCTWGSWIGTTPVCRDTRCDRSSLNYPGLIKSEGFFYDRDSFLPVCHSGYEGTEKSDKRIICDKGTWTGNLPPCTLARCKTESLVGLNGLILEGHHTLDNEEWIQPICAEGFEFSNKNDSKLYCQEGEWVGNLPPCTPAHCLNNPPVPENGRVMLIRAIGHGASVKYECLQGYEMIGEGSVICSYGKWAGTPPTCKDTRCYLRNLPQKQGVDLTNNRPIISYGEVNIFCLKGYNLKYPQVRCENGDWRTQTALSPCQEDDCHVKRIENGEIYEEKITYITNYWGEETGRSTKYELVEINAVASSGASLYVSCTGQYRFQGQQYGRVRITCSKGEWTPRPSCQLPGKIPVIEIPDADERVTAVRSPTETIPLNDTLRKDFNSDHSTTVTSGKHDTSENAAVDFSEGAVSLNSSTDVNGMESVTVDKVFIPVCSCKYIYDDSNVVAFVEKRKLKFNDEINSGSIVTFYCKEPGFYRLRGPSSVQCPSDCSWHSSLFPSCAQPNDNDVIIGIYTKPEKNMDVGPGGVFNIIPGADLQLTCRIKCGCRDNLNWTAPGNSYSRVDAVYNTNTRIYRVDYLLSRVSRRDSGTYTCFKANGQAHSVSVEVKDVECPEIAQTEGLAISYAPNRNFGGRASFHCFLPYKVNGPSYVTCEASGIWSESPASCSLTTCSVGSIYDVIRAPGVVPDVDENTGENVPYGYKLKLLCDGEGLALKGNTIASCTADGDWDAAADVHCAPGCASVEKKNGSELMISPEKQFYNVGESITFACPEEKMLTIEVERILCFKSGWTPNTIPDCQ